MFAHIFFIVCCISAITASCPTILGRNEWNARAAKRRPSELLCNPAPTVVIHHSSTPGCDSKATCSQRIKGFQTHHIDVNKWDDIGYNFIIGGDGEVYEGRGWGKSGAHAVEYNRHSVGICFVGTYNNDPPSKAMLDAAKKLIQCGIELNKIDPQYSLIGHRQTQATDCPGNSLFNIIKTWPHWAQEPHVKKCR